MPFIASWRGSGTARGGRDRGAAPDRDCARAHADAIFDGHCWPGDRLPDPARPLPYLRERPLAGVSWSLIAGIRWVYTAETLVRSCHFLGKEHHAAASR
jgi:hypothetical protein